MSMFVMFKKHTFQRSVALYLAALVSLFANVAAAFSADSATLVSLTGIALGKNEFVEGIALKTQNLRVLAICHIPAGWSVSVSSAAGPMGAIDAGAGGGVAALGPNDIHELRALFLARKAAGAKVSITGTVDTEIRGDKPDTAEKSLNTSNFLLEDADQCPPVGAWDPKHK